MKALVVFLVLSQVPIERSFDKIYRHKALEILQDHLKDHSDCDLKDLPDTISRMQFFSSLKMPFSMKAATFPDEKSIHPVVFVNSDIEWNIDDAILMIIHEATHNTRRNNEWLCGSDKYKGLKVNRIPVCRLFGNSQYSSEDIDKAIRKHLGL
jgi:hypothetical protein